MFSVLLKRSMQVSWAKRCFFQPLNARWLEKYTYLNKPSAKSCRFVQYAWPFIGQQALSGYKLCVKFRILVRFWQTDCFTKCKIVVAYWVDCFLSVQTRRKDLVLVWKSTWREYNYNRWNIETRLNLKIATEVVKKRKNKNSKIKENTFIFFLNYFLKYFLVKWSLLLKISLLLEELSIISDKVFKNGLSKICGRQPLKIWRGMVCFRHMFCKELVNKCHVLFKLTQKVRVILSFQSGKKPFWS